MVLHFKTLQTLFEQEPRCSRRFHNGDKGFDEEYNDDENSGKITAKFKRILTFNCSRSRLLINTTTWMVFGGKVIEHNLYSKNYNVKTFNYFR